MASVSVAAEEGQPSQLPSIRSRATPSSMPSSSTPPPCDSRYGPHLVQRPAHALLQRHGVEPVEEEQVRDQLVGGERRREPAVVVLGHVADEPREALAVELQQRGRHVRGGLPGAPGRGARRPPPRSASTRPTRSRASVSSTAAA